VRLIRLDDGERLAGVEGIGLLAGETDETGEGMGETPAESPAETPRTDSGEPLPH
jgi:hypothetical protein